MELIRMLHEDVIMDPGGIETQLMRIYRNIDRTKVQFDFLVHRKAHMMRRFCLWVDVFLCRTLQFLSLCCLLPQYAGFFQSPHGTGFGPPDVRKKPGYQRPFPQRLTCVGPLRYAVFRTVCLNTEG